MTVEGLAVFRHVREHTGIHGGTNARNGFKMAPRRPLGANQPTAAQAATSANTLSGPQAPERPPRAHRHHLRTTHRHPVAGDARRAGVWLRDDLSSSAQAVAPERCVPEALRGAVGGAQRRRQDRLVSRSGGQRDHQGAERRGENRPQSHRIVASWARRCLFWSMPRAFRWRSR